MANDRFVILPEQAEQLRALLGPGPDSPWSMVAFRVEGGSVHVRYERTAPRAAVELVLAHPSQAQSRVRSTDKFAVTSVRRTRHADPSPLVGQLLSAIRAGEQDWEWARAEAMGRGEGAGDPTGDPEGDGHHDTELVAVLAGAKPALRYSVPVERVEAVRRRLHACGLHTARVSGHRLPHGGEDAILASLDRQRVSELEALEEKLAQEGAERRDRALEAEVATKIGHALGYPPCCVQAHAERVRRPLAGASSLYHAATEAWIERPSPRLNDTVPGIAKLISFSPCRYDCENALALANVLAGALERTHPGELPSLEAVLRRSVVLHPSGSSAWVDLDVETRTVVCAEPVRTFSVRSPDGQERSLARGWVGGAADDRGRLRVASTVGSQLPPLLVDFGGWLSPR